MSCKTPKSRVLVSGTMRGGSSLVSNVLNAHSEIMVLGEYVHFFRFIYDCYNPLNRKSIGKMLDEMHARLFYRYKVSIDKNSILKDIDTNGYTYTSVYDSITRYYSKKLGKQIAGEDAALNWTTIPDYLKLFPDAKVIQIIRDPRSVLASWHKASYQKVNYLDAIFNCIDNMDKCSYYSKVFPNTTYIYVKYEDIINNPEKVARRFCELIGIEFESIMIKPDKWDDIFDGVYVKRGWSSHVGKMTKGFDSSRMDAWKESLEDWELCLCELLAKDRLMKFGYELSGKLFDGETVFKAIDKLRSTPFLHKRFLGWLTSNQGAEGYPDNPRDPSTWGATEKNKELFLNTEDGKAYLKAIEEIRNKYSLHI